MGWVGFAYACDPSKCSKSVAAKDGKGCDKSAQTVADKDGCSKQCPLTAKVMAKLPSITYKVGDFETPCLETATAKAGADGKIQYLVAGTTYDCKQQATAALATLIEIEADKLMTVHYLVGDEEIGCPSTAKTMAEQKGTKVTYQLAGLNFESQEKAQLAAETVRKALSDMSAGEDQPAAAGAKSGCSKAATAGADAPAHCTKGAKAQTAGADAPAHCNKDAKAETASAKAGSGCCAKGKAAAAQTASADAGSGCSKSQAGVTTASDEAKSSGCCKKAAAATLTSAEGDSKPADGATAAVGEDCPPGCPPGCCPNAEQRLTTARAKIELIVQTAAKAMNS